MGAHNFLFEGHNVEIKLPQQACADRKEGFDCVTKLISYRENDEVIEPLVVNEVAPTIEQHKYYIIAGAFAEQKNATRMLEKLKKFF